MKATDRHKLIDRIKNLEGLTDDERAALLGLLRENKTYGLVWEDKPEEVEERLRNELPILVEDTEKALTKAGPDAPNHILIEGDNLEALTTLAYTHEGKIDVIYIDPPYNTGNKDFIYNDSYVDSEDSYRHSKWLSFMSKRFKIAKKLLSDRGVIFISIDDNEQANLKLLCDEIFGQQNFIAELPTIMNLKGNQDEFGFAGTHEYTIVYAKTKVNATIGVLPLDDDECIDWEVDEIGYFKKGASLKSTGINAPREKRPNLYFPIFIDGKDNIEIPTKSQVSPIYNKQTKTFDEIYLHELISSYRKRGYSCILPITGGEGVSWRWSRDKMDNEKHEIIIVHTRNEITIYKKQRPQLGDLPSKKAKSFFYKPEYSSGNGKAELTSVLSVNLFGYPKPLSLIKDFVILGCPKESTILDFFAGSGTTPHAVMQLNAEDGGKRQCILCTNNENGICEKVTYERNKRVINGYTKPNGEYVEGLHNNNLRYYRTDFVGRSRSMRNMQRLVNLSTDMLCIKGNLYMEQKSMGGVKTHPQVFRYFDDGKKQMLIIYREEYIEEIVGIIEKMEVAQPIKVYVFSPSDDPASDLFEPVADKVEPTALPAAIYNTYKRILPKKRDVVVYGNTVDEAMTDDTEFGGLFCAEPEGGEV